MFYGTYRFADDNVVRILSIGQIRPEKNHKMQLEVLRMAVTKFAERGDDTKVVVLNVTLTICFGHSKR
ncbi:unnamed protein product [Nippostrongylus brasiliensis]|uniref:RidA family protein n=1 Tax=Nippostrongylus brasiliensis TaxID=27835 RepID=A0A0N4XRD4_NIPBR|nr:unnamed protein product [Nippostrongylus brasiliensis]